MIHSSRTSVPYRYRVTTSSWKNGSKVLVSEVEQWANEHNIDCIIIPGSAYFLKKADAAFFILRWA